MTGESIGVGNNLIAQLKQSNANLAQAIKERDEWKSKAQAIAKLSVN